jgi:hypothetical protein
VGKGGLIISLDLFGALCGFNSAVKPEKWQECVFFLFFAGLPFLRARGASYISSRPRPRGWDMYYQAALAEFHLQCQRLLLNSLRLCSSHPQLYSPKDAVVLTEHMV